MDAKHLRKEIRDLPKTPRDTDRDAWPRHRYEIRKHILEHDISHFLSWSTVVATMFVGNNKWVDNEFYELQSRFDFARLKNAILEENIGKPERLLIADYTSPNLVHQLYHLVQWMDVSEKSADKLDVIVEFGGGYGAMCAIVKRLGFTGDYYLFDFPEFLLLQQYYLSQIKQDENVHFKVMDNNRFPVPPAQVDLFIACFSLSEAERELRDAFFGMTNAEWNLIAHQPFFGGDNLTKYYDHYMKLHAEKYNWHVRRNPHLNVCRYVIGEKIA